MSIKLKTLAGFFSERLREPATCEACGAEFTCGATLTGCWCSDVKLSDEQRAKLTTLYRNCLCRKCLRHIASGSNETAADTEKR